jgi:hypothetical protein
LIFLDQGFFYFLSFFIFYLIKFSVSKLFLKNIFVALCCIELIDFLKSEIGDLFTIEIGSGNGCIGRSLEIKMTDNKLQLRPEVKIMYDIQGQPIINYGEDIETLDAIEAVVKYKPSAVVACWVTHKYKDGMVVGNMYGIEEEEIFENGVKKNIFMSVMNLPMPKNLFYLNILLKNINFLGYYQDL